MAKRSNYLLARTDPGLGPSIGLLLLRLGVGLAIALGHGLAKLQTLLGSGRITFPDPFGIGSQPSLALAVFGEFVCGLLIALGLATRAAVLPLAVTMLVAIIQVHGDDPWAKKELAFLYLVPAITLLFTGPGRFSLDHKLARRSTRH